MTSIQINDSNGDPVRYAHIEDGNLILQFEYYSRFEGESDYEVIQTIEPSEFESINLMFEIDLNLDILSVMQKLSDTGKGQDLVDALNSNQIKNSLWTWMS